jgi:uncharacterized membrane protein
MTQHPQLSVRNAVLVGTLALLLAICWRGFATGVNGTSIGWVLICTSPLWIPVPWLLRQNRKAYAAYTLCVIPYLIVGITEAVANPQWRPWAAFVLCVAFLLFVGLIAYLRVTRPTASP